MDVFSDGRQRWHGPRFRRRGEQIEDGVAVLGGLVILEARERQLVAGQLAVGARVSERQPDERVEPVKRLEHGHHPVEGDVVAFQVGEFVEEDVPQLVPPQVAFTRFRSPESLE